jgi:predicted O-methyltransferase YrrM
VRARLSLLLSLRALPFPVARLWWHLHRTAERAGDAWALEAATRPADVAAILALAEGRRSVVELGTGPGWTALALAAADERRSVVSYDPVDHAGAYVAATPASVSERVELRHAPGSDGPGAAGRPEAVDMLFIDSTHEFEPTIAEFRAWKAVLAPGAVVAFHDFGHPGYPGVEKAVKTLGLNGEPVNGIFVWRAPGGHMRRSY